jgi:hypothetical protein
MHLNIRNDEAHKLATELAEMTGESLTSAVTLALRERLARERRRACRHRTQPGRNPGLRRPGIADMIVVDGSAVIAILAQPPLPSGEVGA